MAYIAPSSRSTGDIITAGIWNSDVVDNVTALSTAVRTIQRTVVDVTYTNDNTERDFASCSIGANTLGSSGFVRATMHWQVVNGTGSAYGAAVKFYIGATSITVEAASIPAGATYNNIATVYVENNNATNAQILLAFKSINGSAGVVVGTAAIDTTAATALKWTLTGTAAAGYTWTAKWAMYEIFGQP